MAKTFIELMQQLKSGDYHLSPSSLKAFASSPRDFVKYKLSKDDFVITDDYKMGILFESFLLDLPHDLHIYSREMFPVPDKDLRTAKNKQWLDELKEEFGENKVVDQTIADIAKSMATRTANHPIASQLLAQCNEYQKKLTWNVNGVNLLGYTDASGDNIIIDIKKSRNATFNKFQYDIIDLGYLRQMAMYWDAEGQTKDTYIIGCDPSGNVCPVQISFETLTANVAEYHLLIDSFKQCIELDAFDAGYEWHYEGVYQL